MKRLRLSSKVRTAFQGKSRGLTLVELVIAVALIGIIAVALLGGLSNAIMSLVVADVRTTAESLARTQMEDVKNEAYDYSDPRSYEQDDVESTDHPGYFVSVSAEPLHDPDDGIQEITVTVSHHSRTEPVITLDGYKVTDET